MTLILFLVLATPAVWAQEGGATATKKSKTSVDCSKADDSTITTGVQQRLSKSESLKGFAINVATSGGVVTLTGSVKAGRNKGTATRVAKSAPCVKKVDNQITVETAGKSEKKNSGT
jgi:osmotically-inducible protein OsmY